VRLGDQTGVLTVRVPTVRPAVPPKPAFSISELTITPSVVDTGERVTISGVIANTGGREGTKIVTLRINNVVVDSQEVTLAVGASERVTFAIADDTPGIHTVSLDDMSGMFLAKEAAPQPTQQKQAVNWWIIGGVFAVFITGGVVTSLVLRKRRV